MATRKPASKSATDWLAILSGGATGVKRWNRQTAAERAAGRFNDADFSRLDLTGVKFDGVKAARAKFHGAMLARARISGDFRQASFERADLTGANLAEANLAGANFTGALLVGADFTDAVLTAANFTSASLTDASFKGATFDKQTTWPESFTIPPDLVWTGRTSDPRLEGKGKKAVATDINGLLTRLNKRIDPKRMTRTIDMLRTGKNQLFSEVDPAFVRGVVRSQKEKDKVYACVLCSDGNYSCCGDNFAQCMGLRGEPCKHILVLLIGLARAGQIDPLTIDPWIVTALSRNPRWNKGLRNHLADVLLRYKCAQTGEVDWRPTETLPEDYYAL